MVPRVTGLTCRASAGSWHLTLRVGPRGQVWRSEGLGSQQWAGFVPFVPQGCSYQASRC